MDNEQINQKLSEALLGKINGMIKDVKDQLPPGTPVSVVETSIDANDLIPPERKMPEFLYDAASKVSVRLYIDCFNVAVDFFSKAGVQFKSPDKMLKEAHAVAIQACSALIEQTRARLYGSGQD